MSDAMLALATGGAVGFLFGLGLGYLHARDAAVMREAEREDVRYVRKRKKG